MISPQIPGLLTLPAVGLCTDHTFEELRRFCYRPDNLLTVHNAQLHSDEKATELRDCSKHPVASDNASGNIGTAKEVPCTDVARRRILDSSGALCMRAGRVPRSQDTWPQAMNGSCAKPHVKERWAHGQPHGRPVRSFDDATCMTASAPCKTAVPIAGKVTVDLPKNNSAANSCSVKAENETDLFCVCSRVSGRSEVQLAGTLRGSRCGGGDPHFNNS